MRILITGGAGFIGCNTAKRFHEFGHPVVVLDNLSRPGSRENIQWLRGQITNLEFIQADVVDAPMITEIVHRGRFDAVIHLAGQVAVTTSTLNPRYDFEVNALGTLNLLEALRLHSPETLLLYASTNKVYGSLSGARTRTIRKRCELVDYPDGIGENQPLDFHSPYGCSKGAADAYVVDYARIYGLRTLSLRQSCIYGYRQFGIEDQGWVAWFIIAHLLGRPLTIYGNGHQVRDLLFIDDLVDCYLKAAAALAKDAHLGGQAFNIGGGPGNTLSLLEFMDLLADISGCRVEFSFADRRPGDQDVFISNIKAAAASFGWAPQVAVRDGLQRLADWVTANLDLFRRLVQARTP